MLKVVSEKHSFRTKRSFFGLCLQKAPRTTSSYQPRDAQPPTLPVTDLQILAADEPVCKPLTATFFTLPLAQSIIGRHVCHNNTLMIHNIDIIQVINWCLACLAVLLTTTGVCKCCTSIAEGPQSCTKEFELVLTCTVRYHNFTEMEF